MKCCLNTFALQCPVDDKLAIAYKAGYDAVELWIDDIQHDPDHVRRLADQYGLDICSIEQICGWYELDGNLMGVRDSWDEIQKECERRMELCRRVGSPYLIATPPFSHRNHFATLEEGVARYQTLYDMGQNIGVIPTLEFMGQTAEINTAQKALDFIRLTRPAPLVVDAYHIWKGGGTNSDLKLFTPQRISLLHISDADRSIPRKDHRDRDRVMPGDGQIDLAGFLRAAAEIQFSGHISLGVYNLKLYEDPLKAAREGLDKLKRLMDDSLRDQ